MIDLREIDVAVISLVDDGQRRASVTALCERLSLPFRFVDGVRCDPGWIGCGLSHIRALRSCAPDRPVLILEDDITETAGFLPVVETPDGADALYLGTSVFGALHPMDFVGAAGAVIAEDAGPALRIRNMMSSHAILYLTDAYRAAATGAMMAAIAELGWPPDRGLAAIQGHHQVYAQRRPAFVQSGALQASAGERQEAITAAELPRYPIGTTLSVYLPAGVRNVILEPTGYGPAWVSESERG